MRSRRVSCRRCKQTLGVTLPKGGILVARGVAVTAWGPGTAKRLLCANCTEARVWDTGPVLVS